MTAWQQFVFLKLPPAACAIPGYEISLRQCHESFSHMETSIKIIHDTFGTVMTIYRNQASRKTASVLL
jgi:hypothetical protein